MQPMMPHERQELKDRGITDAEIDEYQQLSADIFVTPDRSSVRGKIERLAELHRKFYGKGLGQS